MVPKGGIITWSGAIVDIPTGYQLCDGTNGTPDLRDQFIMGAGSTHAVDDTGGFLEHNHPFDDGGHTHPFDASDHTHEAGADIAVAGAGPESAWNALDASASVIVSGTTDSVAASGVTDTRSNLSPFLALAYIQRMV